MNFEYLYELVRQYQYDEIRTIGRDTKLLGKLAHVAAIMRRDDQLELCLLMQEEPKAKKERTEGVTQSHSNREQMKQSNHCQTGLSSIQRLEIDGTVFDSSGSSVGALCTEDLGGFYLMEKLTDAGWRLPKDHVFFQLDWDKQPVRLMHSRFFCPAGKLPDLERAKIRITWQSYPVWYQIEQPVRLVTGDVAEDEEGQTKLPVTLTGPDGTTQEGICYINRVSLQDLWEGEEQRFADPQYQKQMLEYMTQEEFAAMKQKSLETLEQICPRGMCFPVVEYECTLDVGLEFYTQDYLDASPVGSSSSIMYLTKQTEEQGKHGLRLRSHVLQTPVPSDTQEVRAELFQAVQTMPEWSEELVWEPD